MNQEKLLRILGYISITSSITFALLIIILGFFQPGYSHTIDTISVLSLGEGGFIQQINFGILAIGLVSVGMGLSILIHKKLISTISLLFFIFALSVILLILFSADPVDRTKIKLTQMNTWEGFFHITITMGIIGLTGPAILLITNGMKKRPLLHSNISHTFFVFAFNIIFGTLWFICRRNGILFEWKGLWQKILALNVLVWMARMGVIFITYSHKKL